MQHFENNKSSPLKDDLKPDRTLRSSSPAIKRPASEMGGQEDVDMQDELVGSSSNPQTSNGKRQKSDLTNLSASNPHPVAQTAASEDSSVSDSTLPPASTPSTAATSLMETPDASSRPSIDEQIVKVQRLAQPTPEDKSKGYCISFKWLTRVLARGSEPMPGIEKSALEGEIGPVDNTDITMVIEDSGKLKDEGGDPFVALRPGLLVGEDFQIVPQAAWDLVVQWYGVAADSPIITRYAHAVNDIDVQYEIYPPIFSLLKVVGTQTPQTQKDSDVPPPRILSSVYTPYMKWLKEAKSLAHVDINTKVRVWKVLGGIKSTSASGILTPAASRSASPAPGAEIVASAGTKMIIDVNTFSLLTNGDQRELIDTKDLTADPNYNGKTDLRTLGLGRGEVIVLEEQSHNSDTYPSDSPKFSLRGAAKAKNLTVSGRSSPAPSVMTRGRAQREGRPKGIVGLSNLGNTCYMNSALQCIRSVEELTEYFRCGYYKKELNVDNPLGNHGEVAKAYGNFIENVYTTNSSVYTPTPFKKVIGKYGYQFSGFGQQDSQEFLAFLLDGLQEDLNRIDKKPYIEKPDSTDDMVHSTSLLKEFADRNWNDYKARNDSVITDLFAGMYKSTLTCPVCDKVSIVFDPFSNLTLQLPIENNWSKEIVFFPLHEKPIRVDVDIDKHASILDMKKFIGHRLQADPQKMICAESYKNKFFKIFDNNEILSETSIAANDIVCLYELSEKPTNYNPDKKKKYSTFSSYNNKDSDSKVDADTPAADQLLTPIYHRVARPNGNNRLIRSFFGHPSYVVLSRDDRVSYDGVLKKVLSQVIGMTTLDILQDRIADEDETPEDSDTLVLSEETPSESPSASGKSVQDEDGFVDVSMREASQGPERTPGSRKAAIDDLLNLEKPLPKQLQVLFKIKVAHTDEGIPTGWNSLNESQDFEDLKEKAAEVSKQLALDPKHNDQAEDSDGSPDELADTDGTPPSKSQDSASESGGCSPDPASDNDSINLPEVSEMFSGKDMRGASKHQKKKIYSRKGRKITGKAQARRTPPPPQPKPEVISGSELILPGDAIILDWDELTHDALFGGDVSDDMRGALTHRDIELFEDDELVTKRAARMARKKNGVSLEDCLNEFGRTETLSEQNAWYCPRCKEHRRADKKFELWKVPDILVMHLKRFSAARNFRDKLELMVDYPLEGLDLTSMVQDQSDGKSLIYDLIAVDNHFGGLGGGHYTAHARNWVNGNWYDYNDSHASQVKNPETVVQKSAYLLFYRRRTESGIPLGGPRLEKILTEVDSEEPSHSRDASPSGEGQRLVDSSHNGSSSASAGQAHRVGDGGLAPNQQKKLKTPTQDQEDVSDGLSTYREQLGNMANMTNDGDPPRYGSIENGDMLLDDEAISMGEDDSATVPWVRQGWQFYPSAPEAPPSSNVDETEEPGLVFARFSRRGSDLSAAQASSTGGLDGSDVAQLSDVDDEEVDKQLMSFDDERRPILQRESAPPPENISTHEKIVHHVPLIDDDEDELEVQELRIDSDKPHA